jgi:hypothetical protein
MNAFIGARTARPPNQCFANADEPSAPRFMGSTHARLLQSCVRSRRGGEADPI